MSGSLLPNLGVVTSGYSAGDTNWGTAMNTNLNAFDDLIQLSVTDSSLSAPPASPSDGDRYIVGSAPTGLWSGQANKIARYVAASTSWRFYTPKTNWQAVVSSAGTPANAVLRFNGSAWVAAPVTSTAIDSTTIGSTTPSTGKFTTLQATSTTTLAAVSTTGLTLSGTTSTITLNASVGTAGQVLTSQGPGATPTWTTVSASFTGGTLTTALNEAPIVTLASAATVNIGAAAANTISVSGTTTITAFDTIASGAVRNLVFQGALTLTHNATSLILPTAANITTATDDRATFISLGSGNWKCIGYQRASGAALSGTGSGNVVGPGASVDGEMALFSGTTGALLKRLTGSGYLQVTSGVVSVVSVATQRAALGEKVQALTDGATISVDASLANNFRVTLAGNRTLANPTGLIDGQGLSFRIKQDATGSRTLSYGSKYKFPDGVVPLLSTTANAQDYLNCEYDATDDTLYCVLTRNFL